MGLFSDVASVAGSLVGAGASYLGASAQASAAKDAQRQSEAIYKQQRADAAPYREIGEQALNELTKIYLTGEKPFTAAPGYDYRFNEGVKGLERGAAARGRQLSGAQQKALTAFGQNIGTDEYNQGFNRLSSLAGFGPTAVSQTSGAAQNYLTNYNQSAANAAAARASGYEGIGSSINQGINNMLASHYFDALLNKNGY